MKTSSILAICLGAALIMGIAGFWSVPVSGDAGAYCYSSSKWISNNGMAFIPAGSVKGEQAQGHPTLFFWLWALLMGVFGNSVHTARILPTIAAWLALAGTWKLASSLSRDRLAGVLAVAGLLASPLFLAQSFRPMTDTPFAAAAAWSLYAFSRGRRLQAVLLCTLATMFREMGILLAGSLLLADLATERRFRPGMLLWGIPGVALGGHFLLSLLVNGHIVDPRHLAGPGDPRPAGSLYSWLGHFAGHLLGQDYRWLPICMTAALIFAGPGKRFGPAVAAALLAPLLFVDGQPAAYALVLAALVVFHYVGRRRPPSPPVAAILLFCGIMAAFFTLLTLVSPDPPHDLFRYLLGVYPGMMALLAALVLRAGRRLALPLWCVFTACSVASIGTVRSDWQVEDSPLGLVIALRMRDAISFSDNPYTARPELLTDPALGYVEEPRPFREGERGQLVVSLDVVANMLPDGYRFSGDTVYSWRYGGLRVLSLGIAPTGAANWHHSPDTE